MLTTPVHRKKVLAVIGARPQFIKAAPVTRALCRSGASVYLLHTGQHYDDAMSDVFFRDLEIQAPNVNLNVGSGAHGWQTGEMLKGIESVLSTEAPDWVLVFGDTNSTLAGALAACKLGIPVAHVEAGLRSFNRAMPEEHNRVLADHCADLLLCPTPVAVDNLRNEGIVDNVVLTGDVMYDAVLQYGEKAEQVSTILDDLALTPRSYDLATVHRAGNTDAEACLRGILQGLMETGKPVVFPVHPRTQEKISRLDADFRSRLRNSQVRPMAPVGYLDMLRLEKNARLILTDSGGMQKEAYFFRVPCVTLRNDTEWSELIEAGVNRLAGSAPERIRRAAEEMAACSGGFDRPLYGDGASAERIAAALLGSSISQ